LDGIAAIHNILACHVITCSVSKERNMSDLDFSIIAEPLKIRAIRARRSAWISVLLIVLTVFIMINFFYGNNPIGRIQVLDEIALPLNLVQNVPEETEAIKIMTIELQLKKAELDVKRTELNKTSEESSRMTRAITESFTKVGAVIISIYLIQILLSLMRYHFKLADHFETVSESMKITTSDVDKLEKIMSVIGVGHIEFGKAPETPANKLLDIAKELSKNVRDIKIKPNALNPDTAKNTPPAS
jgi:uncharacterized membrane-anchored protein YhcB (DUF1043 family)